MRTWAWPDSRDAVIAAPKHHGVVLDSERVRVLDTRVLGISPGERARLIESLPPHSIENVGTSEIHPISVEMKAG